MRNPKRFLWTLTLFWTLMLLFVFMVFVLLHTAPWWPVKFPLITMSIGVFGFNVHLLAKHYSVTPVKLSTETVENSS
ncbi:MAG: hypothetical protein K2P61_02190 [Burkholderiaceae bacterium]|nr:hypothetical protein [Burkholderiaceae bacterium]